MKLLCAQVLKDILGDKIDVSRFEQQTDNIDPKYVKTCVSYNCIYVYVQRNISHTYINHLQG